MTRQAEPIETHGASTARPASPTHWSSRQPKQAAATYLMAYLLVAAGAGLLVANTRSPIAAAAVVTAAWVLTLALSLLLVLSLCRLPMRPRAEVAWIFAMMVLFCLARPAVFAILGSLLHHPLAGQALAKALSFLPGQQLFGNVALITWAAFLGKLVSRIIREGKLLLPIALVAALADTITVFWGPVAHLSEKAPEIARTFSASAPLPAPPHVATPILAAVGIGDFLFLALFLAAALRYSMEPVKTLWAAFAATLVAPLVLMIWPADYGLPGLPFIAVAVLWANWRHLAFTREEKRALTFAGALVAAAAVGLWAFLHR